MLKCCLLLLSLLIASSIFAQTDSLNSENEPIEVVVDLENKEREVKVKKGRNTKKEIARNKEDQRTATIVSAKTKKSKTKNRPNHLVDEASTGFTKNKDEALMSTKTVVSGNCKLAYDIIDEFSGKRKKALEPRLFFGFTPKSYQKFFPDDDYIQCFGNLVERDGQLALHLSIIVQDKSAMQQFGTIDPGAKIFIRPMKSSTLSLTTYKGATISEEKNRTIYECSFPLSKSAIKTLKKDEIDTIRILWTKGYQTYEVYYLDFLKDQFPCFEEL